MFTGIIEATGTLERIEHTADAAILTIAGAAVLVVGAGRDDEGVEVLDPVEALVGDEAHRAEAGQVQRPEADDLGGVGQLPGDPQLGVVGGEQGGDVVAHGHHPAARRRPARGTGPVAYRSMSSSQAVSK